MENTFRALANANRIRIILILLRGPLNVSEISRVLHLGQSNVSHYLKQLLSEGLVRRSSGGGWVYYSLDRSDVFRSSLIDSIALGREEIREHSSDLEELSRCYSSRRDESRAFFDRIATDWDSRSALMPIPSDYIRNISDALHLVAGGTVLDAGCGSGELLGMLASQGMTVIGGDQSPEMLSEAGKRFAGSPLRSDVHLRLGSAEHLPVGDSSVDGVVAHMILHHLGEPSLFFSEAARVLSPGGRCVTVELAPHDNSNLKRIHGDLWPGLDLNEVIFWMQEAGFQEVRSAEMNEGSFYLLSGVLERTQDREEHDAGS